MTTLNINEAVAKIAEYNPILAKKFFNEPFNRVTLARAFSCGFVKNPEDDAPSFCYDILMFALADKDNRASMRRECY